MDKISERFIKGLLAHNLTFDEIDSGDWKYCGGTKGSHARYFALVFPNRNPPQH
jgi:hypothetical protein